MPEPTSYHPYRPGRGHVENVLNSKPPLDLQVPERPSLEDASIFHLVRTMEQMIKGLEYLGEKLDALVRNAEKERTFIDTPVSLGLTLNYTVAYQGRKFLFIYSAPGLTLAMSDGTTKVINPHTWTNISMPRGTIITASGGSDTTPSLCTVRACDILLSTN